jgi:hypothetical protein
LALFAQFARLGHDRRPVKLEMWAVHLEYRQRKVHVRDRAVRLEENLLCLDSHPIERYRLRPSPEGVNVYFIDR